MKKYLIATMLMLAVASGAGAASQTHRHHAATTKVERTDTVMTDSTAQNDELEAFSDTTATEGDSVQYVSLTQHPSITFTSYGWDDLFGLGDKGIIKNMLAGTVVIFVLLFLSPIALLALLFYFIYKNRKQRMQFAEQAMRNGQPIPDNIVNPKAATTNSDLRTKGIRQICLGVGLMILLSNIMGNIGLGIGALVFCIGLGNMLISRQQRNQSEDLPHTF
jgi:hypothetical protein